jgi:hypothetical protein
VLTRPPVGGTTVQWWNIYEANTGLFPKDLNAFETAFALEAVTTPASFSLNAYAKWMNEHGPLWMALDPVSWQSNTTIPKPTNLSQDYFHDVLGIAGPVSHVIVLTKIEVDATPPGIDPQYWITLIDPEIQTGGYQGGVKTVEASVLWKQFEKWVTRVTDQTAFKVIYFKDKITH